MDIQKLDKFITKKNEYGICIYNNQKCFYKIKDNINREVLGYNLMKDLYIVPKLLYSNDNLIIYEYKESLINNSIHEYLYFSNKRINYSKIINQYQNSYNNHIIIDEDETINKCFFKDRINLYDFDELKDIIDETKKVLLSKKNLTSFITQGDPTDTNISINGIYSDFENAGLNSAIGEIAIMFVSFITHGKYFYPKYNSNSYKIRNRILNKYNDYKPNLNNINIPSKNINLMIRFLNIFKDIDIEINKYLKYYIIFRLISPIDVNKMDNYDKEVIKNYIIRIYNMDMSIKKLIKLIKEDKI